MGSQRLAWIVRHSVSSGIARACVLFLPADTSSQLGTHLRAKNKREEMTSALRKLRAAGQDEKKAKKK